MRQLLNRVLGRASPTLAGMSPAGGSPFPSTPPPPPPKRPDTNNPHDIADMVWRVTAVGSNVSKSSVPDFVEAKESGVKFIQTRINRDAEYSRVAWARDALARVAPHVVAILGPQPYWPVGGRLWGRYETQGDGDDAKQVIIVDSTLTPDAFRETFHHEIWHALEENLSRAALNLMKETTADGIAYDNNFYHESGYERRARLYEKYASLRDLGLPSPGLLAARVEDMTTVELLEYVYSGGLAIECAQAQWFRAAE